MRRITAGLLTAGFAGALFVGGAAVDAAPAEAGSLSDVKPTTGKAKCTPSLFRVLFVGQSC